ncbi:hypothetical protein RF819_02610 [Rhodoferax fermentans]|uniref:Uncharacterized protein n=1 Tax=Rhodoferax fermentans TaxID=28066 RepID=A0A1T1ANN0_RHOFE|nr:hypothetical protein RF819_02610 [Rhodoferax fermentans]
MLKCLAELNTALFGDDEAGLQSLYVFAQLLAAVAVVSAKQRFAYWLWFQVHLGAYLYISKHVQKRQKNLGIRLAKLRAAVGNDGLLILFCNHDFNVVNSLNCVVTCSKQLSLKK